MGFTLWVIQRKLLKSTPSHDFLVHEVVHEKWSLGVSVSSCDAFTENGTPLLIA